MPFLNRVQQLVTTTGTGASISLGAVYAANANTMTTAGAVNAKTYSYVLTEGNNFEVQLQQTYNSAGTMTRGTPVLSLVGGTYGTSQISLLGGAVMAIELLAEDLAGFFTAAGGTLTGALNWATAATVASATTTDIGAAASNLVTISGTTPITGLGTIAAGAFRWVKFGGILTLTYNATSLINIGAANITTAAGDMALFVSEGSGNWRMFDYKRADGTPIGGFATTAQFLANTANKILEPNGIWGAGTPVALTSVADATVTMTIASPGVITDTAHGLLANAPVHLTTTGALPTGLTASIEYYVVGSSITTNTYQLSLTRGGAAINTSGSQSGTHTRVARVLIDWSLGINFTLTLVRNITLAKPYNQKAGQAICTTLTQDGTGSRTIAAPNAAAGGYGIAGGTAITLSTAAGAVDDLYMSAPSSSAVRLAAALAIA